MLEQFTALFRVFLSVFGFFQITKVWTLYPSAVRFFIGVSISLQIIFTCLFAISQKSEKLFSSQTREFISNGDEYLSIYLVLLVFFLICVHLIYYQETVAMLCSL